MLPLKLNDLAKLELGCVLLCGTMSRSGLVLYIALIIINGVSFVHFPNFHIIIPDQHNQIMEIKINGFVLFSLEALNIL